MSPLLPRASIASEPIAPSDASCGLQGCGPASLRERGRYLAFLALASVAAALLVTFFFCPQFVHWRGMEFRPAARFPAVHRAVSTFEQIDDPFAPIPDPVNWVIAWRLLLPVIWHYLALPRWLFLLLPYLGCLFTLGLTAHIVFQRTANRQWAFLSAVLMGACPWFFISTGWLTYFDSWVMGGLLLLGFGKSRFLLALICLLTPWIDERFLMAAPLCFLVRAADNRPDGQRQARDLALDGVVLLLTSLTYPLLRVLLARCGLGSAELGSYANQYFSWQRIASISPFCYIDAVWSSVRAGWFFVGVLFWVLWAIRRRLLGGVLAMILIATIAVGLVTAADIGRSVGLVAPLGLLGVLELARRRPNVLRIALPTIVAANLLLPAEHVIADGTLPIYYFYVETNQWHHPPPELDPNAYTQESVQFIKQGKVDLAMSWLNDAIRLDPRFARAYVTRSAARAKLGDLDGAIRDLDQAIQLSPKDSDVYFARAALRKLRQDRLGAISDLRAAIQFAPGGWIRWQEARELLVQWSEEGAMEETSKR